MALRFGGVYLSRLRVNNVHMLYFQHLGKSSMEVEGGGGDAAGESLLSVLASKHDKNGFTPLHLACLNYKQLEVRTQLVLRRLLALIKHLVHRIG